ncbi:MAG: tRNA 2-selenouridine(34) synthase MnmH [Leptolyngbyaceae cyanobacterium RU_5_1]|nr:tRNA 2-selenouridine(34) synthase MnmH [Leptolyngbyaceae cyanobacterium RU_5_1]
MPNLLTTVEFLSSSGVVLDVRSPAEYEQGHIPGSVSFPLFTDAERAEVGTCYKQQGRSQAVELGLAIAAPKLTQFVQQAKQLAPDLTLRIHCWRGGMRSGSMAWLMETAGFQVSVLDQGYKGFRHWVRETLAIPKPILTLGGMTGTGKTAVLHALADQGEQVLDLEALANHRGSSYGGLGLPPQPSTEQFENLIAIAWAKLDATRPIWIEAESRMVGTCRVPNELFEQMMAATVLQIERSRPERIALLQEVYGSADRGELVIATDRLQRRLGGQNAKRAIAFIQQGNLEPAIEIVLDYYDKTYLYDLQRRNVPIYPINVEELSATEAAAKLIKQSNHLSSENLLLSQHLAIPHPLTSNLKSSI